MKLHIRKAFKSDRQAISEVVTAAFGHRQGAEVRQLVNDLLADPSAQPLLSLVATIDRHVIGHILFTNVRIEYPRQAVSSAILAPLSVQPEHQRKGAGSRLVNEGLKQLRGAGVDLVFVLGHPGYYTRHGFSTAGTKGFDAPYPIPPENADAWMVQELHPGIVGHISGQVICANALNDPRHWRE